MASSGEVTFVHDGARYRASHTLSPVRESASDGTALWRAGNWHIIKNGHLYRLASSCVSGDAGCGPDPDAGPTTADAGAGSDATVVGDATVDSGLTVDSTADLVVDDSSVRDGTFVDEATVDSGSLFDGFVASDGISDTEPEHASSVDGWADAPTMAPDASLIDSSYAADAAVSGEPEPDGGNSTASPPATGDGPSCSVHTPHAATTGPAWLTMIVAAAALVRWRSRSRRSPRPANRLHGEQNRSSR